VNKNEFRNAFDERKWFYLIQHDEVWDFIKDYDNIDTIKDIMRSLNEFVEEKRNTNSQYEITNLLNLNEIEAREDIWNIVKEIMRTDKSHRLSKKVRTWVSQFYETTTNKTLMWKKRKYHIKIIPQRKLSEYIPKHEDIHLIVSQSRILRDRAIVLTMYNSGILHKGLCNLKMKHMRGIIEKYANDKETPMILKITAEIMPKRFGTGNYSYLISLIERDCAELLLKYYQKQRKEANDEEYFFVSRTNQKLATGRISKQTRQAILRASDFNPKLVNTQPKGIRTAFNNRLIEGHMNERYIKFLMMHNEGVEDAYFNEEYQRQNIIPQYRECYFNREGNPLEQTKKIGNRTTKLEAKTKKIENHMEKLIKIRDEAFSYFYHIVFNHVLS